MASQKDRKSTRENGVQNQRMALLQSLPVIRKALEDHALGKREMTVSQVKAATVLMNKIMPDLKAVEHTGELRHEVLGGFIFKVREADAADSRD